MCISKIVRFFLIHGTRVVFRPELIGPKRKGRYLRSIVNSVTQTEDETGLRHSWASYDSISVRICRSNSPPANWTWPVSTSQSIIRVASSFGRWVWWSAIRVRCRWSSDPRAVSSSRTRSATRSTSVSYFSIPLEALRSELRTARRYSFPITDRILSGEIGCCCSEGSEESSVPCRSDTPSTFALMCRQRSAIYLVLSHGTQWHHRFSYDSDSGVMNTCRENVPTARRSRSVTA